jgi:DNA-binding GntR family transcriptional regulator
MIADGFTSASSPCGFPPHWPGLVLWTLLKFLTPKPKGKQIVNIPKKRRPNLSEIAYDEIKEMILSGEVAQGERILLDEISERLNLSITPIREALNKLAQEDLIQITPRTSHAVISLDAKDASDILELRLLLETFAFQTAGDNLAEFPVQRFRDVFQRPELAQNYKEFVQYDAEFHSTIIAASNNKKLGKLYAYLQNLVLVELIAAAQIGGRIEAALEEHLKILDAIEARDVDLALAALRVHLKTVEKILSTIQGRKAARKNG